MWGGEMREQRDRPGRWWPLVLGVVVTVVVALLNLDVRIQDGLARPQSLDWVLSRNGFERWVYHQGPLIPMSVFVVGLVVWLGSFGVKRWRRWRRTGAYVVLCMLLGPGLVVNAVFKDHYGRPRPKQTERYGGAYAYKAAWEIGYPRKCKSFPCGHASVAFFYMGGYFLWYRSRRRLAQASLAVGLICGAVAGYLRMGVGAHWFSDVVWSGIFVYYCCYASAWLAGVGGLRRVAEDEVQVDEAFDAAA